MDLRDTCKDLPTPVFPYQWNPVVMCSSVVSIMRSRYIQVVAWIRTSFLFMAKEIPTANITEASDVRHYNIVVKNMALVFETWLPSCVTSGPSLCRAPQQEERTAGESICLVPTSTSHGGPDQEEAGQLPYQ